MTSGEEHVLSTFLVVRELTAAARHAMALHEGSDGVSFNVTFDKNGMQLDVTHLLKNQPISGWGL